MTFDSALETLIKERLSALSPQEFFLHDDSEAHHGHAGALESGGRHYHLRIISDAFLSISRVQRHRLVYNHINDLMPHRVHALSVEAFTIQEWCKHNGTGTVS
jgi:BolA family transcriptional regulator, general stress-responsive regulator